MRTGESTHRDAFRKDGRCAQPADEQADGVGQAAFTGLAADQSARVLLTASALACVASRVAGGFARPISLWIA